MNSQYYPDHRSPPFTYLQDSISQQMLLRSSTADGSKMATQVRESSCSLESYESLSWPEDSPDHRTASAIPASLPAASASITLASDGCGSAVSTDTALCSYPLNGTPVSALTAVHLSDDSEDARLSETVFQNLGLLSPYRQSGGYAMALRRSVQTFATSVSSSTLLMSALTHLDHAGHPSAWREGAHQGPETTVPFGGGLRWTLSSMLALFLRSGRIAASESDLLAILWILESWVDAHRSNATPVLGDYVRYLAAFDATRAQDMTDDWEAAFTQLRVEVVDSQLSILQSLGWSVRLGAPAVAQCYQLLFGEAPTAASLGSLVANENANSRQGAASAAAAAEAEAHAVAAAAFAATTTIPSNGCRLPAFGASASLMNALCAHVCSHSKRLKPQFAAAACDVAEKEDKSTQRVTKRQRMI